MATTTRKVELFRLAARTTRGVVDYGRLFDELETASARERTVQLGDRLVALTRVHSQGDRVLLRVLEGPIGLKPLIYNARRASERFEDLDENEIVATRTHAVVDLGSRRTLVEYNQRGAKASDLQSVLQVAGRTISGWESLEVSLTPVPQSSFVDAIARFKRVRVATLKLARPNIDWNDSVNALNKIAAQSNANSIAITVVAGRSESLESREGVLDIIRKLINQPTTPITGATISGTRRGEIAETSVSLRNFIEHQRLRVELTNEGHVEDKDIEAKMIDYMDELDDKR